MGANTVGFMRKVLWFSLLPLLALLASGAADADTALSEDRLYDFETLTVEGNLTITNGSTVSFLGSTVEFETPDALLTIDHGARLVLDDTIVEGNATLMVQGELALYNATSQASLVLNGGRAWLWNSTLTNVTCNGGELTSGYLLRAELLTPFAQPVAGADWEVEVPALGWSRTGQADAFGQIIWIGVPTAIRNASGEVSSPAVHFNMSHPDEGRMSEALNLTSNTFLRLPLEIDLRVLSLFVVDEDGDDHYFTNESFTVNAQVMNAGTSNLTATSTLAVLNPVDYLPLEDTNGRRLIITRQMKVEPGETEVISLAVQGIPVPGHFMPYFRLFANHTLVSPLNGTVEIMRNQQAGFQGPRPGPNGTTLPGEILALVTPTDDNWTSLGMVRAPTDGITSEIFVTNGAEVTAGTPLMRVEFYLLSGSTDITVEQSPEPPVVSTPEPPETLLGMEYKTWTYLLLFTTGLGTFGVAALWWRLHRPNT